MKKMQVGEVRSHTTPTLDKILNANDTQKEIKRAVSAGTGTGMAHKRAGGTQGCANAVKSRWHTRMCQRGKEQVTRKGVPTRFSCAPNHTKEGTSHAVWPLN